MTSLRAVYMGDIPTYRELGLADVIADKREIGLEWPKNAEVLNGRPLVGIRSALKELYVLKNINIFK